jgi:hypothetical protein
MTHRPWSAALDLDARALCALSAPEAYAARFGLLSCSRALERAMGSDASIQRLLELDEGARAEGDDGRQAERWDAMEAAPLDWLWLGVHSRSSGSVFGGARVGRFALRAWLGEPKEGWGDAPFGEPSPRSAVRALRAALSRWGSPYPFATLGDRELPEEALDAAARLMPFLPSAEPSAGLEQAPEPWALVCELAELAALSFRRHAWRWTGSLEADLHPMAPIWKAIGRVECHFSKYWSAQATRVALDLFSEELAPRGPELAVQALWAEPELRARMREGLLDAWGEWIEKNGANPAPGTLFRPESFSADFFKELGDRWGPRFLALHEASELRGGLAAGARPDRRPRAL